MKLRVPHFLFGGLALGLAALAFADWLPLIHNLPVRDNPNDPSNPFLARSQGITAGPPTPRPTVTPTSVCGSLSDTSTLDGFESGIGTWACIPTSVPGYTYATVTAGTGSPGGSQVCDGTGSLCGSADYVHGGGAVKVGYQYLPPAAADFNGETLSAMVYFPAAMGSASTPPSAKLFVKTGSGYTYYSGSSVNAPTGGGWVQLVLYMGAAYENGGGAAAPVANPTDVLAIGLDVYSPNGAPDGTFDVCMDVLNTSVAPTATASPTATPTETPGGIPPTATSTPTPVPTFTPGGVCGSTTDGSTIAGFEGGLGAWTYQTYTGYTPATMFAGTTASSEVCLGYGSLCGTASYAGGGTTVEYVWDGAFSFAASQVITAEVLFPPGMGNTLAQLYVKTGSGYVQYTGSGQNAAANAPADGGWIPVTLNLGACYQANGTTAGAAQNLTQTGEIGLDIDEYSGAPSGTFTVCLDALTVN